MCAKSCITLRSLYLGVLYICIKTLSDIEFGIMILWAQIPPIIPPTFSTWEKAVQGETPECQSFFRKVIFILRKSSQCRSISLFISFIMVFSIAPLFNKSHRMERLHWSTCVRTYTLLYERSSKSPRTSFVIWRSKTSETPPVRAVLIWGILTNPPHHCQLKNLPEMSNSLPFPWCIIWPWKDATSPAAIKGTRSPGEETPAGKVGN